MAIEQDEWEAEPDDEWAHIRRALVAEETDERTPAERARGLAPRSAPRARPLRARVDA